MLIEYKDKVVNLKNVIEFKKSYSYPFSIEFVTCLKNGEIIIRFNSDEERDKAYEKIIDSYRWERHHVNLNENG